MKKKRIIVISILVIVTLLLLYFYLSGKDNQVYSWKTYVIERGDIRNTITATGSINALTTVQVGSQVSGTISKLFVDFNSVVKKGQIIAELDTTFLSAAKDEAEAALERTQVQLAQTKIELERVKKLFDENVTTQADYDLALTNYESALSNTKSAKAQLNRAKINLQYATIKAPISGVVISRNVDVGQTIVSSFNTPTLFTIANDLTKMQVYANIDEADIGQIKIGQEALFTVDAYPNELFNGKIKQIRLQSNVIQNVVNYTVILDVANPQLKLLPGLTANININIKEHKNILKVPSNALHYMPPSEFFEQTNITDTIQRKIRDIQAENLSSGKAHYIWIKKEQNILPCIVTLGLIEGGYAEVSGNIKDGDEIVTGTITNDNKKTAKNPFLPNFSRRK